MPYKVILIFLVCLGIGVLFAVFRPWSSSSDTPTHFMTAIRDHGMAASILNKAGGSADFAVIPPADWKAIDNYNEKALEEARQADISEMNKTYPGFGNHFRDEFIGGLQLYEANKNNDPQNTQEFLMGQMLVAQFGDWYEANLKGIQQSK